MKDYFNSICMLLKYDNDLRLKSDTLKTFIPNINIWNNIKKFNFDSFHLKINLNIYILFFSLLLLNKTKFFFINQILFVQN